MGKVDGLSRRVNWKVGIDKDNDNQVLRTTGFVICMK